MSDPQQPGRAVRVILVDDQPLVRAGLHDILTRASAVELVGEAQHGAEAVQLARLTRPDVVLMDIGMPVMDGVEATRRLCNDPHRPAPRVLILTVFDDQDHVFEAIRAGASGFLLKTAPTEEVIAAVTTVSEGGAPLSPSVARRLVAEIAARPVGPTTAASELAGLTDRELDVFRLLVCGYHNDEIAGRLVVGESTVKSHVQSLYRKIGVRDRVQAVIYAYEHGLLYPGVGSTASERWIALAGTIPS
jgi:DNA-binding NarL/FixJ family response regulator